MRPSRSHDYRLLYDAKQSARTKHLAESSHSHDNTPPPPPPPSIYTQPPDPVLCVSYRLEPPVLRHRRLARALPVPTERTVLPRRLPLVRRRYCAGCVGAVPPRIRRALVVPPGIGRALAAAVPVLLRVDAGPGLMRAAGAYGRDVVVLHLGLAAGAAAARVAARQDAEQDQRADAGGDANDDGLVL